MADKTEKKEQAKQLEVANCDFKLGRKQKKTIRLHAQWSGDAKQCVKVGNGHWCLPHRNHDRFLNIDEQVYLLGASLKDMGTELCAITEMASAPETILELLK